MSSNSNGLLSNRDVSSRADLNANYFRRTRNGIPVLDTITRAHAWGTFDITGSFLVLTTRSAVNQQSATRQGAGQYTITMATPLVSDRYCVIVTQNGDASAAVYINYVIVNSTQFRIFVRSNTVPPAFGDPQGFSYVVYGIAPGPPDPANQSELVVANNGLFTSSDLAATGQIESNYYVLKNLVTPLLPALAVRAYAFVSLANPGGSVTIANSFGVQDVFELTSAGIPNLYRVVVQQPLPQYFTVVATTARTAGVTQSLIVRAFRENAPFSFLLIINQTNTPTQPYASPTGFYFAVFSPGV